MNRSILLALVLTVSMSVSQVYAAKAVVNVRTNKDVLTNGLVAYWTLDGKDTDWNTNTTNDVSGNGNTGTMTNMSTTSSPVTGILGQGMFFDDSNDIISAGSGSSIDDLPGQGNGGMTISLWAKPRAGASDYMIAKGTCLSFSGTWALNSFTAGRLLFSKEGTTDFAARTAAGVLQVDRWQHVVVTWDGGTTAADVGIYVNGVLRSHDLNTDGGGLGSDAANTLSLGGCSNSTNIYNGSLDEVRLYNRILPQTEIIQLYNSGKANFNVSNRTYLSDGLIAYWPLDGKTVPWTTQTAATALDIGTSSTYTLTVTNMIRELAPTIGKIGQGLYFDGINDYMVRNSGSAAVFNFTYNTPFSVAMWLKPADTSSTVRYLLNKRTAINNFEGWLTLTSSGLLELTVRRDVSQRLTVDTASAVLSPGVWTHAVFTYDGSNSAAGMKIYVDGTSRSLTTVANLPLSVHPSNAANLMFGARDDALFPYVGAADDIRVYNRALSATEAMALYKSGKVIIDR